MMSALLAAVEVRSVGPSDGKHALKRCFPVITQRVECASWRQSLPDIRQFSSCIDLRLTVGVLVRLPRHSVCKPAWTYRALVNSFRYQIGRAGNVSLLYELHQQ